MVNTVFETHFWYFDDLLTWNKTVIPKNIALFFILRNFTVCSKRHIFSFTTKCKIILKQKSQKWNSFSLKSGLNEGLFVLKLWELICKSIKLTTIFIFKKYFTHKKYLNNNYFLLSKFGFIRMKVEKTLFLPGFYDVVDYSLLRKWRQNNLCIHELSALWFEYNVKTEK